MSFAHSEVFETLASLIERPTINALQDAAEEIARAWVQRERLQGHDPRSLRIFTEVRYALEQLPPLVAAHLGRAVHSQIPPIETRALSSWTETLRMWAEDAILPPEEQEQAERS